MAALQNRSTDGAASRRGNPFETDGAVIIGSDGHPNYPPTTGDNIAIALNGSDKARLTRIFNRLAEGGGILAPLHRQSSGAEVGWLSDKFGIRWTVRIDA